MQTCTNFVVPQRPHHDFVLLSQPHFVFNLSNQRPCHFVTIPRCYLCLWYYQQYFFANLSLCNVGFWVGMLEINTKQYFLETCRYKPEEQVHSTTILGMVYFTAEYRFLVWIDIAHIDFTPVSWLSIFTINYLLSLILLDGIF